MKTLVFFNLFLLFSVGLAFVFSASGSVELTIKQMLFFVLGSGLYWALQMRTAFMRKLLHLNVPKVLTAYAVAIAMLVAVLLVGREINGARRWLSIGGVALQPTEFVKVFYLVYLAWLFDATRRKFDNGKFPEIPAMISHFVLAFLVLAEPDFGSFALLSCVFGGMLFVAGLPWKRTVAYALIAGIGLAVIAGGAGYRSKRIEAYQDPWSFRYDAGYQTVSSYEALGSGGWVGVGYRNGTHKGRRLPEAQNDYILSVIGEEFGLVGVLLVMALYLSLLGLVLRLALSLDGWRQLYAAGTFLTIAGAVSMNMYVVSGMLPSKGIALPMISSGGSSLLACILMFALLVRWSEDDYAL